MFKRGSLRAHQAGCQPQSPLDIPVVFLSSSGSSLQCPEPMKQLVESHYRHHRGGLS